MFCQKCGYPIWAGKEHVCQKMYPKPITREDLSHLSELTIKLLEGLINAEAIIDGTHENPERGKSKIKRIMGMFELEEDVRWFYMLPTSTEECPTTSWEELQEEEKRREEKRNSQGTGSS
jgi:hypothetical protein